MCNGCKYFIEDTSVNACDCNKADELTEVQLERYFVNDKDGCPYREEEDNTAEDEYFDSLMKGEQMILTVNIPKRGQKITNGDMIKALFPNMPRQMFWSIETEMNLASHYDWWNAHYKAESEGV